MYGYYFLCLPIQDPYILHIYSPYHDYNYSYLMLTNFIGSSFIGSGYMSDVFAEMLPYIKLYMGSVLSAVCVFFVSVLGE